MTYTHLVVAVSVAALTIYIILIVLNWKGKDN